MSAITFDQAIEILEITNIDSLNPKALKKQVIKTKKRWHPDTVAHLGDPELLNRFTQNFQLIEPAAELISSYLKGDYVFGDKFRSQRDREQPKEAHEIIRENAPGIQGRLLELWATIKQKKFKHRVEEVILSDGFVLRDLLKIDFKEDIAMLSVISFITYNNTLGLLTIILAGFNSTVGLIGFMFWLSHAIFCFLAFLPLSRFWLPEKLQSPMIWFVNFGLKIYDFIYMTFHSVFFVMIFLQFIRLIGKVVKYLVLFPLYEFAKLTVGGKIVGIVKKKVDYYADTADWYIEELLHREPAEMSTQELYDLSYLYSQLVDVERL